MKSSRILAARSLALAISLVLGAAAAARAGAPQPDTRQGDFEHVCKGGAAKGEACTVPTEATDCPRSECVPRILSKVIRGTLTLIAHDSVTDWAAGGATNRALTAMLEVRSPDGVKQMLTATYQDLVFPTEPPQAPSNVVAIPIDEAALRTLASAPSDLLFARPESRLAAQLQTLFGSTGTPVIVAASDRAARLADHVGDELATVLRFPVRIQFLDPA
jgi:hypothetical protein